MFSDSDSRAAMLTFEKPTYHRPVQRLYVTNAAFPFFSTTFRPSVLRVDVGVAGKPR